MNHAHWIPEELGYRCSNCGNRLYCCCVVGEKEILPEYCDKCKAKMTGRAGRNAKASDPE